MHDLGDNFGHALGQVADLALQPVDLAFQPIDLAVQPVKPLIMAIEARLDGSKIVGVTAGLVEDVATDHLFTFDLALDDIHARFEALELIPRYVRGHAPPCPLPASNLAQG